MAQLRIIINALTKQSFQNFNKIISSENKNFAKFDSKQTILNTGFYKKGKLFENLYKDFYVADYFEEDFRKLPSLNTELHHFGYLNTVNETERRKHPILLKLAFSRNKGVLCIYSKQKLKNEITNNLIIKLKQDHNIQFKYVPKEYIFKEDQLDAFVNAIKIKDYTAISIWDHDNRVILKNPEKITETKNFISFLKEHYKGNWSHIKVPFDEYGYQLKINNSTQRFLTLEGKYKDDLTLLKIIDFILNKIFEVEDFSGKKQMYLDTFITD